MSRATDQAGFPWHCEGKPLEKPCAMLLEFQEATDFRPDLSKLNHQHCCALCRTGPGVQEWTQESISACPLEPLEETNPHLPPPVPVLLWTVRPGLGSCCSSHTRAAPTHFPSHQCHPQGCASFPAQTLSHSPRPLTALRLDYGCTLYLDLSRLKQLTTSHSARYRV